MKEQHIAPINPFDSPPSNYADDGMNELSETSIRLEDMFQNEERIQSMISNNGNLDYVSRKGFLKFVAIKTDGAPIVAGAGTLTINGEFNTFYTIENTNAVGGADIDLTITFPSGDDTSIFVPAGSITSTIVNGVGNTQAPNNIYTPGVSIYSDVFN